MTAENRLSFVKSCVTGTLFRSVKAFPSNQLSRYPVYPEFSLQRPSRKPLFGYHELEIEKYVTEELSHPSVTTDSKFFP